MKKISLLAVSFLFAGSVAAQTADQMKDAALASCEMQAAQVPAEQQEMIKKNCECSVKKTDYDKILKASASGDISGLQEDAMKVAQECAKESGLQG